MPALLHISDLHAGGAQQPPTVAAGVAEALAGRGVDCLVVSGDFANRGQEAERGGTFVRAIAQVLGVPAAAVVCCPGNHDIGANPGAPFASYLTMVTRLTGDARRGSPSPCSSHRVNGIDFLTINSCYHGDRRFGRVLLRDVERELAALARDVPIVCVVHHHLIPYSEQDKSHVVNAYPLLQLLAGYNVQLLLHGHRHLSMALVVGDMRISGIGSLTYPPEANVNNQFALIDVGRSITRFRRVLDAGSRSWVETAEAW